MVCVEEVMFQANPNDVVFAVVCVEEVTFPASYLLRTRRSALLWGGSQQSAGPPSPQHFENIQNSAVYT